MFILHQLQRPFTALLELLYPHLCLACEQAQPAPDSCLCYRCHYQLKPTHFQTETPNPVLDRFWGRVELEHAATSFAFSKGGLLQHLIHQLKYGHQPQIGIELGQYYGQLLSNAPLYHDVETIVPVPLHPIKQRLRGYNQAEQFARGIADTLELPCSTTCLVRTQHSDSQTRKSRLERFANVETVFEVAVPTAIQGKHVLLVDDVITTGATLEACAKQLLMVEGVRVSVGAIALASR